MSAKSSIEIEKQLSDLESVKHLFTDEEYAAKRAKIVPPEIEKQFIELKNVRHLFTEAEYAAKCSQVLGAACNNNGPPSPEIEKQLKVSASGKLRRCPPCSLCAWRQRHP